MLTLTNLLGRSNPPRINLIDLPLLQELYEKHLVPFAYDYILSNGERIKLYFHPENFCHLLGLDKIAKSVTTNVGIHNSHKGHLGWKRIKEGRLTIQSLRGLGGSYFNHYTERKIVFFYTLPQLLLSGSAMVQYVPISASKLNVELILFDTFAKSWVHLGLEKESDWDSYYPKSFFIERISAAAPASKYVYGQPLVYSITWRHKYNRFPTRRSSRPTQLR
jgi:hypothetical protein